MSGGEGDHKDRLKRAIVTIRRLEARIKELERAAVEPIAIVGLGCRFPGNASRPEEYWALLERGVDAITEVPADRWDRDRYFDPDPSTPGKMYTLAGGFLDGIDTFDAAFFGISPRVAAKVDPQHRLLLEVVWEALENAGIAPSGMAETSTGVFVGVSTHDYLLHLARGGVEHIDAYSMTGPYASFTAGRLAYLLGLQGPAMAIDTACSSSLVAAHVACESLRARGCDLAIVAGVNAIVTPDHTIACCKFGMLSRKRGRCLTFDATADGFIRSEGCGALVMKRLSDARKSGDPILAVVRGSAVNQDGATSGLTVPNKQAQVAVIRRALEEAGLAPDDIDFVEAHGTGTPLGDPIELRGLAEVFAGRDRKLRVGSVKTNIGHTEAASGIAGLLKVVLALQRGKIPPHLHFASPTPHVDWERLPIEVPTTLTDWEKHGRPRRAGVSSFGASGTNAHLVLEEWEEARDVPTAAAAGVAERPVQLLCLSAQTETALAALARSYGEVLAAPAAPPLADICYTAAVGRSHFAHRLAVAGDSQESLRASVGAYLDGRSTPRLAKGTVSKPPKLVFLFAGRGVEHASGAAAALHATEAEFRRALEECASAIDARLGRPLIDRLLDGAGGAVADDIDADPVLFAFEYALARLWMSWGVAPAAVSGYGLGEYVAACVAGVFSLADALELVSARARLFARLPAGAMLSAAASEESLTDLLAALPNVAVAARNGHGSVVLSGDRESIAALAARLAERGIAQQPLTARRAHQSPLVDPILDELEGLAARVPLAAPTIPIVSTVTGRVAAAKEIASPQHWRRHARAAIEFHHSVQSLRALGADTFLEVGPERSLVKMARRALAGKTVRWHSTLGCGSEPLDCLTQTLGALYVSGAALDWRALHAGRPRRKVPLPNYPFERVRHWISLPDATAGATAEHGAVETRRTSEPSGHPLLGGCLASPLEAVQFEQVLSLRAFPWLEQHRIVGQPAVPAAAFLEIALAACHAVRSEAFELRDFVVQAPLAVPSGAEIGIQTVVEKDGATLRVRILGLGEGADARAWTLHASGSALPAEGAARDAGTTADLERLVRDCPEVVPVENVYAHAAAFGAELGPAFRTLERLRVGRGQALGWVRPPGDAVTAGEAYLLHPTLVDAWLQIAYACLPEDARGTPDTAVVPMSVGRIALREWPTAGVVAHAVCRVPGAAGGIPVVDLHLFAAQGAYLGTLRDIRFAKVRRDALARSLRRERGDALHELVWHTVPAPALADAPPANESHWLVLAGRDPLSERLVAALRAAGRHVCAVRAGDRLELDAGDERTVRPAEPADFVSLIEREVVGRDAIWQVVHAWGPELAQADHAPERACGALLHLVQAFESRAEGHFARLVVVTSGADGPGVTSTGLVQSPLWGLRRVIAAEQPRWRALSFDVDDADPDTAVRRLFAELELADGEREIVYRTGTRFVPRLARVRDAAPPSRVGHMVPQAYELYLGTAGLPDTLALRALARRAPGPGEIEIEVVASGLNFRDVLIALDVYRGSAGGMGSECAGRVVAVGPDVEELRPGDEVVAIVSGGFASHVIARASLAWRKPEGLSFEQAAALPIAFLTAAYCLDRLGGMRRGHRVLVHCAAGGVGMAAVQLARRAGAEIFGTAGSPEKRALIAAQGVDHVSSSRTLDFANEVLAITQGRGVDLVLNSLAGDFIPKSLSVLAPGGRFLEIGRTGIWSAEQVAEVKPDVGYFPVLLGDVCDEDPRSVQALGQEVFAAIEQGALQPLPVQTFSIAEASEAMRLMAQAKHTGKLVLRALPAAERAAAIAAPVHPDGSYLVTGGFGGLGLEVARWLARSGAGQIVLMGRRAPSETARAAIREIEAAGVSVVALEGDVSRAEDVRRALAAVDAHGCRLRGVLHTAGTKDDHPVAAQRMEYLERAFAAKVHGTRVLHELTRDRGLDLFVLFSSVSALFGAPGQASYAAANAFMDAFASWCRASGIAAISIDWGPWGEVGMFAATGAAAERAAQQLGMEPMPAQVALDALEQAIGHAAARSAVFWSSWARRPPDERLSRNPLLRGVLAPAEPPARPEQASREAFLEQVEKAPERLRRQIVQKRLRASVAGVLGCDPSEVQPTKGFRDMGMDSLMSVELRNRLQELFTGSLSATLAFDYPTLDALTDFFLERLVERPVAAPPRDDIARSVDLNLDSLSEEEAERLLLEELGNTSTTRQG